MKMSAVSTLLQLIVRNVQLIFWSLHVNLYLTQMPADIHK